MQYPQPCDAKDGTHIHVYANIGSVDHIGEVLLNDADGIGLFRSEFLYLDHSDYPSEEELYRVYRRVLESMAAKKVIIRTLDIGADKQADYFHLEKEDLTRLNKWRGRSGTERRQ